MFNKLLAIAVVAGALAGAVVTGVQALWTTPLILAAEVYETVAVQAPAHSHTRADGAAHEHAAAAEPWAPEDGLERTFWTLVANVATGVGGGLILAAVFAFRRRVDATVGFFFGAVAFAAFGLAPALGLPPELPGTAVAALGARQAWWAGTAAATLAGLGVLFGCRRPWLKVAGLLLLALPHLVGAPHPAVESALAPEALQHQFAIASVTTSAVFWIVLGGITGFLARRFALIGGAAAGNAA